MTSGRDADMEDKKDSRKAEEMEDILEELEKESASKKTDKDDKGKEDTEKKGCGHHHRDGDDIKKDGKQETGSNESVKDADKACNGKAKEPAGKDPKQEKIDELNDKVMRQMAEFDNYRKRTEKEKDSMFDAGARSVVEKILPIVDNFERGITTVPEEEKDSAFVKGIQMIYKQLSEELDKMGVKPIEAVGKPFNPDYHNAVMQVDDDKLETGTVAQELQKGYTYHDIVIRHSMVAVVK
jgi:molecular chaperone GrpE